MWPLPLPSDWEQFSNFWAHRKKGSWTVLKNQWKSEIRTVFIPQKCPIHQYPALTREFRGFSFSSRHWIALHGVCYLCFCTSHTLIPNQKKSVGTEKRAKHLKDPKGLSIRFLTILTIARLLPSPNSNRCYLCQCLGPIMDAGTLGPTNRPLSLRSRTWFIWRTQLFIFSCSSNKDF